MKLKALIISIVAVFLVGILAVIAVLTAMRQNTPAPVAPTVPQVTPHAQETTTTPQCTLNFTVAAPPAQSSVCDKLTLDVPSGQAPLKVHATLTGHANPTGTITAYKIDFGDGSTPYSAPSASGVEHQYNNAGTYAVTGTVVDNKGNVSPSVAACQATVTVSPPPATYTYQTCQNNACVTQTCNPATTPCPGLTTCQLNSDCAAKIYQHKVCLGSACTTVSCSPPTTQCADSCSTNADCSPSAPQTHKECRNNACVTVSGAGTDTCTSDVSCQPKATPPPIPKSGNTALTIGGLVLGIGAVAVGLLFLF